MTLKILKANEPIFINRLTVAIYGQPGIGKTSLGFTADAPLLFDFDRGAHRTKNRKDTVQVESWSDVIGMTKDDLEGYSTIVVDTVGRLLDLLSVDIIRRDARMGRNGALTQQGWGRLKVEFQAWINRIHSFGKDIVLIAHGTEKTDGDSIVTRLDVQGGSKDEIYKSADVMGSLYAKGGRRYIALDPTETAFGKNPGDLPILEFRAADSSMMADIIANTKKAINAKSEHSGKEHERIERLKDDLHTLETIDEFNRQVTVMMDAPANDKSILVQFARKKGFVFDRESKRFVSQAEGADGAIPTSDDTPTSTRRMTSRPAKLSDRIGKTSANAAG